jgi:hypothetical protein
MCIGMEIKSELFVKLYFEGSGDNVDRFYLPGAFSQTG